MIDHSVMVPYLYTAVLSLSGSMVEEDTDEEELVSVALKKNGSGEQT